MRWLHWLFHFTHWHLTPFDAADGVNLSNTTTLWRCQRCKYIWYEARPTYRDLFGKMDAATSRFWKARGNRLW